MGRQTLLFNLRESDEVNESTSPDMRILNWNISNPSIERAYKQFEWLIKTKANIIILTEAKYSKGCRYLRDALTDVGFKVYFPKPLDNDYTVIIAEKGFQSEKWNLDIPFLPHRIESVILKTFLGDLKIIGLYVPSRGPQERRNVNKKKFQNQMIDWLNLLYKRGDTSNLIVGGDLNVIEPDHIPHYSVFGEWEYVFYKTFTNGTLVDAYRLLYPNLNEYSWFGRSGDGYRFDHFFVSENISSHIKECHYLHEPRLSKLSDHSAMSLEL